MFWLLVGLVVCGVVRAIAFPTCSSYTMCFGRSHVDDEDFGISFVGLSIPARIIRKARSVRGSRQEEENCETIESDEASFEKEEINNNQEEVKDANEEVPRRCVLNESCISYLKSPYIWCGCAVLTCFGSTFVCRSKYIVYI